MPRCEEVSIGTQAHSSYDMFQTEINLYLQSFASDGVTSFMRAVTATGYDPFYIGLLVIVMMGVDFRRGFLLFQLIVWTGILTEVFKNLFALPRPTWVDARVLNLESGEFSSSAPVGMGAQGFFQLPPRDIVEACRQQGASYGFPSGHVAGACATWGGLALLFRKQALYWLAPVMAVLMALSRMYLGRHFLADALGGVVVGGGVVVLAYVILDRARWGQRLFERQNLIFSFHLPNLALLFILLVPPILLLVLSLIDSDQAGYILGLDVAFLVLMRRGLSRDAGSWLQRAARVLLVGFLFFAVAFALRFAVNLTGVNGDYAAIVFFQAAAPSFLAFWAGVLLCDNLGLYGNPQANEASERQA